MNDRRDEGTQTQRPIEIGVTNRICTGTNAVTGRDAAVTSWSPVKEMQKAETKLAGGAWRRFLPSAFNLEPLVGLASSARARPQNKFTNLALSLLRHRGKMASTAGIAPATST